MNAAVDDSSDQLEQQPEGPGARLKAARLAAGLDLERVAAQLHIRTTEVQALEIDQYQGFAARVFVRGYLRNYARLVALPVDEVLAAFDAVYPDPHQAVQLRRVGSTKPQLGSGHGVMRMVSWALLIGILVLFLVWWAGYLQIENGVVDEPLSDESALNQAPALPPPPITIPESPQVAIPAAPEPVAPDNTVSAIAELPTPVAVIPQPTPEQAAEPVATLAPAVSAPATPTASASQALEVVLAVTGSCWVNVRDQTGTYSLVRELKAGERVVLGGKPPYRMTLGNAPVAVLSVAGQPVDLAPHTRGRIARLTLDPDAQ